MNPNKNKEPKWCWYCDMDTDIIYNLNGLQYWKDTDGLLYTRKWPEYCWDLTSNSFIWASLQRFYLPLKTKEMTVSQISDVLGYPVKIVEG